jgi:rhodanese-related sulfurtransferase
MNFLQSVFGKPAPSLNAADLGEKLKNGKRPFILDVRQPEEYRSGHIAGAKLVPLGDLTHRMGSLPKDKEIICVCASGNRSSSGTCLLVNAGYNAFNMKGGMVSWRQAGLPVKKGDAA